MGIEDDNIEDDNADATDADDVTDANDDDGEKANRLVSSFHLHLMKYSTGRDGGDGGSR